MRRCGGDFTDHPLGGVRVHAPVFEATSDGLRAVGLDDCAGRQVGLGVLAFLGAFLVTLFSACDLVGGQHGRSFPVGRSARRQCQGDSGPQPVAERPRVGDVIARTRKRRHSKQDAGRYFDPTTMRRPVNHPNGPGMGERAIRPLGTSESGPDDGRPVLSCMPVRSEHSDRSPAV